MSLKNIDASMIQKAFLSSAVALDSKKEWINELNVFPVPDGDTGTNMTLTMMAAAEEVAGLENPDMTAICKVISSGTLRGARGNSGVITSQLLRGFTKVIREEKTVDSNILAAAVSKAVETAYKAVMKPKEGTILTVARAMSDKAVEISRETDDIEVIADEIIKAGNDMLAKTPDMLPVLKQAGVVDSGGQGLMVIVEAAVASIKGNNLEFNGMSASGPSQMRASNVGALETSDIRFGYCTEFIVHASLDSPEEKNFKAFLGTMGDSVVCVVDDDLFKVHVHTDDPGKVITKALTYGQLSGIKIDNLREENAELIKKELDSRQSEPVPPNKAERKKYGIITVSAGQGLSDIFRELGVDYVIEGGQTMNPSTDDFVVAIEKVNADVVYILPNNKNIILAAKQAAGITDNVDVHVIPSKSIPLGITAMMSFNPEAVPDDNETAMTDSLSTVKYCEVTYAIRDTVIDGFDIHNGDYMAIGDDGMLAVEQSRDEAAFKACKALIDGETEIVTVYYGSDVTESEAVKMTDRLIELYPDVDFDVEEGDQPVYSYFISIE
ncbi:MAG: DAK2 domain-containing protein [Lachnospiraceae bacterium]|nr:DAK2 domain-containing protein [Lachnospiraceae bacterium]